MKQYRVAIVGTGKSVGNHLTAIQELGDRVELVAAVDLDEARVCQICAEHDIPHWYTDARAMLDAERPDLVHIVTPPAPHKQLIIDALDAGAWALCEKPFVASLAEFDQVMAAEERTGRYASTIFQWRFGAAAKHVKRLIGEGQLGRPLVGVCNTMWYRTDEYYRVPWRGRWETEVGGPTATLGIHLTDLFLWLYGGWRDVQAQMATLDRDIQVEDVAMALVRFDSGALGSVVNSVLSPRQESYLRLDLQRATVEVNALYRYTNDHWRITAPDSDPDPAALAAWRQIDGMSPGSHAAQLRDLLDCMDAGVRPPASGLDSRSTMEFTASLYKAALSGGIVSRGTITPDDPFYYAMNGQPHALTPS
jgi:predicted dehydrogenase